MQFRDFKLRIEPKEIAPAASIRAEKDLFDVSLNMKKAFHQGYIEKHGTKPPATNPLFHEYDHLLVSGDEFRFKGVGFGSDKESKQRISGELGRIISRAYLSQFHNMTWFQPVQNLINRNYKGYSVEKVHKGDTPDWLCADSARKVFLAEAKGRSPSLSSKTEIGRSYREMPDWRNQFKSVKVIKDGVAKRLKGWIVANRWVTQKTPKLSPLIYVEDPASNGQEELKEEQAIEFTQVIASLHTARNLERLGYEYLAIRVIGNINKPSELERREVHLWRCLAPGLENLRFVGRILPTPGLRNFDFAFDEFFHFERGSRGWLRTVIDEQRRFSLFDGIELSVLKNALSGEAINEVQVPDLPLAGLSILRDGSLIAPMDLMESVNFEEV